MGNHHTRGTGNQGQCPNTAFFLVQRQGLGALLLANAAGCGQLGQAGSQQGIGDGVGLLLVDACHVVRTPIR